MTAIVQDRIREAILVGELVPGSRIDQAELAGKLDVSLVPIREALKKLEAEGFVKILPRRGAFVTNTSINDIEDLYQAREVLEGQTAFLAAAKLSDRDITMMQRLMPRMDIALHKQDFVTFSQLNREFHFTVYDAANNGYLRNNITSLWDLAERYRYRYMFLRDQGQTISREHRAILDACIARDGDTLRMAIIYHMRQTLQGIKRYLEEPLPDLYQQAEEPGAQSGH